MQTHRRFTPHKRLKRFLSPAFTVGYVDNLERIFKDVMQDLLKQYSARLTESLSDEKNIETDLMDDLHKAALDM
jgi:cytochrome P450